MLWRNALFKLESKFLGQLAPKHAQIIKTNQTLPFCLEFDGTKHLALINLHFI
jgi:hypothetical protein